MKTPLRRGLRIAAGVVGIAVMGLGVGICLAFTPAVQTWVAQRFLRDHPDLGLAVERLELGWSRSSVTNLTYARDGLRVTAPRVDAEIGLVEALWGKVKIRKLDATDWIVAIGPQPSRPATAAASGTRARAGWAGLAAQGVAGAESAATTVGATPGHVLLDAVTLPEAFSLDAVTLRGKVIDVGTGSDPATVVVDLKGGGVQSGAAGGFDLTAVASRAGNADQITLTSRLEVVLGPGSRLDAVRSDGTLTVRVAGLPTGASIAVVGGVERTPGVVAAETYRLTVRREGAPWLEARADRAALSDTVRGSVNLSLNDRDVASALPGRPLPEFSVKVDTTFSASRGFELVEVAGKALIDAARWDRLSPELASLGAVRLTSDFGLSREGNRVRVASLRLDATEKIPLFGIELRQPFAWNPASGDVEVADPTVDLATFRLRGVPLAAFQAALPEFRLEGGMVTGAWSLRVSPGGIAVRNTEALTVSRFSVNRPTGAVVRDVQLDLRPSSDITPRGWQVEVADLFVRGGDRTLARGAFKVGRAAGTDRSLKVTGTAELDLPPLLAQPVLALEGRLTSGVVQVSGSASLDQLRQWALEVRATRLVEASGGRLPDASCELRVDQAANGVVTLRLPLKLESSGRVSDLLVAGQVSPAPAGWAVDGQITGGRIFVRDAQLLAAPWAAKSSPAQTPAPAPVVSSAPPWSGLSGKISVALGEVVYSPELVAREVRGTIAVDQVAVILETLQAILGTGGRVEASGRLSYVPARKDSAYTIEGNVTALEVEAGPALRAFLPSGGVSPVEGRFDLRSHVRGGAASLDGLVRGLQGDLQIVSRGGVLRPVPAKYLSAVTSAKEQLQRRTEQAGTLGALAGALGARLPSSLGGVTARTQQLTTRLGELEAALRLFGEIRFDQLTLDLGVASDLSAALRDLTLTSPELRFVGQGALRAVPGQPLWRQPLSLKLMGGARGRSAEALRRVNLLSGGADALGYVPFAMDFTMDGTPGGLDASRVIASVAERVFGVSLPASDIQRLRDGDPLVLLALATQLK